MDASLLKNWLRTTRKESPPFVDVNPLTEDTKPESFAEGVATFAVLTKLLKKLAKQLAQKPLNSRFLWQLDSLLDSANDRLAAQ